jgi:hypothetical protein
LRPSRSAARSGERRALGSLTELEKNRVLRDFPRLQRAERPQPSALPDRDRLSGCFVSKPSHADVMTAEPRRASTVFKIMEFDISSDRESVRRAVDMALHLI